MSETAMEMPRYKSHKEVWALKIDALEVHEDKSATIAPADEGYAPFTTKPGWAVKFEGNEDDRGYYVVYEGGYASWSPTEAFEGGYTSIRTSGMTFSEALDVVRAGGRVAREGWSGKGMFIFLVPGSTFRVNRPPLLGIYAEGTRIDYHAHIDMRTANGQIVPWLASQTDLLAEDWVRVD